MIIISAKNLQWILLDGKREFPYSMCVCVQRNGQADLTATVGVSSQAIVAIETAGTTPGLPLAFRIARAFGKTVEEVFLWEDDSL